MPGPKGVIIVTGNRKKAEECFQKGSKIADAQMVAEEWQEHQKDADPSDLLRAKKPAIESVFQSSGRSAHPVPPWELGHLCMEAC